MKMEDENEDEWQMVARFEVVQLLFISSFFPPNSPSRALWLNYVCVCLVMKRSVERWNSVCADSLVNSFEVPREKLCGSRGCKFICELMYIKNKSATFDSQAMTRLAPKSYKVVAKVIN